jgi:hypothetical protein
LFVFYEGATAAGITLKDEKFGMLYGNHINIEIMVGQAPPYHSER